MAINETEVAVEAQEETTETTEETEKTETEETTEESTTDAKEETKAEKPKETLEQKKVRLEGQLKRVKKDLGETEEAKAEPSKPRELDDAAYAILAVKGYENEEDISFIEKQMKKWDMPIREILKDEDMVARLSSMKKAREVKAATPSSTKRSGQGIKDDVDFWYQKYEHEGKLPSGMPSGMAEKLVSRRSSQSDSRTNPYE